MIRRFDFATVVNVVDGDTCDITIDQGFGNTCTHRFRLARINTPERGQPGWAEATAFLKDKVLGKAVSIESTRLDKFGRYLADIIIGGENVNDALLAAGLAKLYGAKEVQA